LNAEEELAARVLDALLREDYGGLSRRVEGDRLRLPCGRSVALTTRTFGRGRYPGFLADRVVAEPVALAEVLAAVRALADPRDDVDALERECAEALRARRLRDAVRPRPCGVTRYEALAATVDHPVYPTACCRLGVDERDLLAYAPEFGPAFPLRWATVRDSRCAGERPAWWPGQDLFPVHPLTARLIPTVPGPTVIARPTLSMRTVVTGPREQLKLPLPTSTLGLRNRRTIMPGTLEDGALVERVLRAVLARERQPVLLADEQTHGHTGDPLRAYLVRRLPADGVPVAALLARTPEGRHVIEELSERTRFGDPCQQKLRQPDPPPARGGDPTSIVQREKATWGTERDSVDNPIGTFFRAYLDALFGWNVMLLTRYGVALEAHQQNVSIVPGEPLRLMLKDNDGALLDLARVRRSLGHAPDPSEFADRRLLTDDREALARVFVTITVHLCAGAIAFGLAERGLLTLDTGLRLVRDSLAEALDAHDGDGFLRARTLDAERLPGKAMLTAGTLVGKDRTGAADINKHYGPPGPNYLRGPR
jgi:siderophore synthetase component